MRVTRSQQAETDALDIALHVSEDSMVAAERFLDQVEIAVRQLQQFPRSGPPIALPQFPKLRCLAVPDFPKYLLFYLFDDIDVLIVRVGDSWRDWSVILDEKV